MIGAQSDGLHGAVQTKHLHRKYASACGWKPRRLAFYNKFEGPKRCREEDTL